jgi:hypothetical protein
MPFIFPPNRARAQGSDRLCFYRDPSKAIAMGLFAGLILLVGISPWMNGGQPLSTDYQWLALCSLIPGVLCLIMTLGRTTVFISRDSVTVCSGLKPLIRPSVTSIKVYKTIRVTLKPVKRVMDLDSLSEWTIELASDKEWDVEVMCTDDATLAKQCVKDIREMTGLSVS